jgi:RND family efflux transporter MFP subunit
VERRQFSGVIGRNEIALRIARDASTSAPDVAQWGALANAADAPAFCTAWLALVCSRLPGVVAGLIVLRKHGQAGPPLAVTWPDPGRVQFDLKPFAERAFSDRRTVIAIARNEADAPKTHPVGVVVAVPVGVGDEPFAVAAVALTAARGTGLASPETIAERLRWGAGWLEAVPWAERAGDATTKIERAAAGLDLLAVAGAEQRLTASAMAIANDLAMRFRCDRVAIGTIARNCTIRLRAISHSASFRKQSALVDAIENAMEEAVDQGAVVAYPPNEAAKQMASFAHRALAKHIALPAVTLATVPMGGADGPIGAITLERHRDEPFDSATLDLIETIASLLGPILARQQHAERLIAGRIADLVMEGIAALFGRRRPGLKLAAAASIALAIVLAFAQGEHRVTAKSVLEPEVQRAAVASFDGYIRTALVRAGDSVRQGDVLASLDDRDLVLDQLKWRAEQDKLLQKEREALANHDRASVSVLAAQIRQARSQLALADEKLTRTRILAPFDGLVVSGDLSQMLGSPVEKGKVLFEIAPLESYRLIVQVDERDVRYVKVGQTGTLALAGIPGHPLPFTLTKITPVTVAEEGRNSFRIEARLADIDVAVRPGMEGVAKIEAGQRSLIWIWTHAIFEWLRLTAWKYLP